jgi:MFS family permease
MFTESYRRYVLGALTAVYTLNFLDRGLIGLLLQPIQADLHLSDTQLGFLTGIAFGLFYATLGVPIARWADRGNRASITSLAIGLWGLTVMSCVLVTNFTQLVLARIAAAIGESGCMPPTYSLVGDYFPRPAERVRAMAIYWLANPLAALISFIAGGRLNEHYGWRVTFFIMGLPALLVAVLVKATVLDPRGSLPSGPAQRSILPGINDVLRWCWYQHSARHLGVGIVLLFTMGLGLSPWYAAFMIRTHGMGTAELGLWLGVIAGVCATAGTLFGGYAAAKWCAEDEQRQMRLMSVITAALVPSYALFLLVPGKVTALLALGPLLFLFSALIGPMFALLQRLVADRMRATTLALVMLLANLIGMGVGPQVVGILSDQLRTTVGNDSLRYAMLTLSLIALWAAYHFWKVSQSVRQDLIATALESAPEADAVAAHGRC